MGQSLHACTGNPELQCEILKMIYSDEFVAGTHVGEGPRASTTTPGHVNSWIGQEIWRCGGLCPKGEPVQAIEHQAAV